MKFNAFTKEEVLKKLKFAKKALPLFALFIVFCISVFAASRAAYGWFSLNKVVEAQGLKTSLEHINIKTEYGIGIMEEDVFSVGNWYNTAEQAFFESEETETGTNQISLFSSLMPNEKIYLAVRYTSEAEKDYLLDLFLVLGAETPFVTQNEQNEDLYAYFGSQLRVNNVYIGSSGEDETLLVNKFLVANPNGESYFTSSVEPPKHLKITSGLELDKESVLTLFIEVEFVDNHQNQNLYQNFGSLGGECSRFIALQILDNID